MILQMMFDFSCLQIIISRHDRKYRLVQEALLDRLRIQQFVYTADKYIYTCL